MLRLPYLAAIAGIFISLHISAERIPNLIHLKGLVFTASAIIIFMPLIKATYQKFSKIDQQLLIKHALLTLVATIIISWFVHPSLIPASNGAHYARMTINPFAEEFGLFYRRLLLPTIAHVLMMRGPILYGIFSWLLTYCLIFLVLMALPQWPRIWQQILVLVSVGTSSFIILDYQVTGYTDHFVYILLLLMTMLDRKELIPRLSCLILGLATHDYMIFAALPLIVIDSDWREKIYGLGIIGFHALIWTITNYGIYNIYHNHLAVGGVMGTEWFDNSPLLGILGAFMGFKLLWAIILVAIMVSIYERKWHHAILVASVSLFPLCLVYISSDANRGAGVGFLGLLMAITSLYGRKWLLYVFAINLLVPSFGVCLHAGGIDVFDGIYWLMRYL